MNKTQALGRFNTAKKVAYNAAIAVFNADTDKKPAALDLWVSAWIDAWRSFDAIKNKRVIKE